MLMAAFEREENNVTHNAQFVGRAKDRRKMKKKKWLIRITAVALSTVVATTTVIAFRCDTVFGMLVAALWIAMYGFANLIMYEE